MPSLQLNWHLTQQQLPQFKLNPRMIQDINILQLPITELQIITAQELEKNPALEIINHKDGESLEQLEEYREKMLKDNEDEGYSNGKYQNNNPGEVLEQTLSNPESLHQHLLWQLGFTTLSESEKSIAKILIDNLDDNGFHISDPYTLIKEENNTISKVISVIQKFEPFGICVSNVAESLRVQIDNDQVSSADIKEASATIIEKYLVLLEKNEKALIARTMGKDLSYIEEVIRYISGLTPYPGRKFSRESTQFIIPDLIVHYREGQFSIATNNIGIPQLGINNYFFEMSREKKFSAEERKFAGNYVTSAQIFLSSLKRRERTLVRIAELLIKLQPDFFINAKGDIKPLTLKTVAQHLNFHTATISRAVHHKYIQTDWGVYPLRHLFSNAINTGDTTMSRQKIKKILTELIDQHTQMKKPVRDSILVQELANRGVHIARRTVNKYRHELMAQSYR